MQTALIITTVNVPTVLALYRKLGPDVAFFVAIDKKTPDDAVNFCQYDIPNCTVLFIEDQQKWKCSELLGWNNDSRRNIALLEAIKWGADVIVSIDDDMIPTDIDFFERIEMMLSEPYSGLQTGTPGHWFDAGQFTDPPARQRGLPSIPLYDAAYGMALDVQVGAMQGIILGVPDTDAQTMIRVPFVKSATDILNKGFVVDPNAKSVFNSQLTAFRRELAPCFAQFYKWQGRNTDIFASLVMRRVMQELDLHTYFGPPTGFHNRSKRNPMKDLEAEKWGVTYIQAFEKWLDGYVYMSDDKTALEMTRRIYSGMSDSILPRDNIDCALAFLDDMEKVL